MKKKTTSRLPLPLWAQILLPLLVAVLCAGILLLGSIRPYEMAKTYLKVAFMDGSGVVSDNGTNGLNIVQTDIDNDYTGETAEEGTPVVSDYGSQCAVLEAKSIGLYAPVNTFFHDLNQLKVGDTVTAYTTYGKFTYEVTEQITFDASDKSYLKKTDDERLTLYTCEMQLLGSSSKRVGVVCKLTDKAFYTDAGTSAEGGNQ